MDLLWISRSGKTCDTDLYLIGFTFAMFFRALLNCCIPGKTIKMKGFSAWKVVKY